jgi:hypothetical protein
MSTSWNIIFFYKTEGVATVPLFSSWCHQQLLQQFTTATHRGGKLQLHRDSWIWKKERKILGLEKKWYYEGEISVLAEVMTPEAKASSQRVCTSLLLLMTKKKREPSSLTLPGSAGPSNPASVLSAACLVRGAPMSWMKPSNDASFLSRKNFQ